MKKLIVIFLLVTSYLYAETEQFDCIGASAELSNTEQYKGYTICATNLGLWYDFDLPYSTQLTPYGNTKTWYVQGNGLLEQYPILDSYLFGGTLKTKNFSLDVNHFCIHAVMNTVTEINNLVRREEGAFFWDMHTNYNDHMDSQYKLAYDINLYDFVFSFSFLQSIDTHKMSVGSSLLYTYSISNFKFISELSYRNWFNDDRNVYHLKQTFQYKNIGLTCQYYKSSRTLEYGESSMLYDEPVLTPSTYIVSIKYTFN